MNNNKNYYFILSLDKECTKEDIKNSYRKLSKKYHPDVCTDEDMKYMFQEINESYDVLYNDILRNEWDIQSRFGRFYDSSKDLNDFEFSNDSDQYTQYKEEFLKSSGDSIHVLLHINKFTNIIKYKRNLTCNYCEGSGYDKSKLNECVICKGDGTINDNKCMMCLGSGYMESEDCDACYGIGSINGLNCSICKSTGKVNLGSCLKCDGMGRKEIEDILELDINDFKDNKLVIDNRGHSSKVTPGLMGNVYIKLNDNVK